MGIIRIMFKFLRSIITSLSFFVVTVLLIICIILSTIKMYNKPIKEYINVDNLVKTTVNNDLISNQNYYNITYTYIENYIDYIFYKNSYPSISESDNKSLSKAEKKDFEKLKNRIDLSYFVVLKIREINNFLTNGAVYFLVRSSILVFLIIISIIHLSISRALVNFSKALMSSGMLSLLLIVLVNELFLKIRNNFIQSVFISLINKPFLKVYFDNCIIFIFIGYVLWVIELIIINKIKEKNDEV